MKSTIFFLACVTLLGAPSAAFAYLSPEQVFGGQTNGNATPPPPTAREGEDRVTNQQQVSAERRAEEQQALRPSYLEPQDTFAPSGPVNLDITPKKDPFSDTAVYEKRMEKLNQKSTQPTIIIGGNGSVVDSRGNVLHSGAPLVSQTGPESAIALALIGVAALSTLAYAFVRS